MRRCLSALLLLLLLPFWVGADDKPLPVYPQPGGDIPGPFHTYNVSGRKKNKFHCLVSEHELNPVVMVVVRGLEVPEGLKYLLIKLDQGVQKNLAIRLGAFAVFLSDKLKDVAADDDVREEIETRLREEFPDLAKFDDKREGLEKELAAINRDPEGAMKAEELNTPEKLKTRIADLSNQIESMHRERRLTLALDANTKLEKYKLDEKAEIVVLLYQRFRVVAVHNLTREQLTKARAIEILREAHKQFGARPVEEDK